MNNTRVMAVDVGIKRIGIALSDVMKISAQPYKTLINDSKKQVLLEMEKIIKEESVSEVVIGFPKNMDGSIGKSALLAEHFADNLKKHLAYFELPVTIKLLDERLTTCQAEKVLIGADVSRQKRKKVIDKMAAVLILQAYLS